MKITFTGDMKLGLNRFAAGDELDIPDERFAQALITAGHATAASEKKPKKPEAKEAKEEPKEEPKAYKTRQIKAEKK
jgi:hypothetical protein